MYALGEAGAPVTARATPTLVISQCLEFDACRYDGQRIENGLVRRLRVHARCLPLCPEVALGLGIPRDPILLVAGGARSERLVQPSTGRDLTDAMERTARALLDALPPVDGFLLKSRSPSCGIADAKVLDQPQGALVRFGPGRFARAVLARFSGLAVEDEERLGDPVHADHFLIKLFTLAAFRAAVNERPVTGAASAANGGSAAGRGSVAREASLQGLTVFHARAQLLLFAYDRGRLRAMERLLARADGVPRAELTIAYGRELAAALAAPASAPATADALQRAFSGIEARLPVAERARILAQLEACRQERVPRSAPAATLRAWAAHLHESDLERQLLLSPYPQELAPAPRPST